MKAPVYTNGFYPGELVVIDMPSASFDGMETVVIAPRSGDVLEQEEVLVRNPCDQNWIIRLHETFLVKSELLRRSEPLDAVSPRPYQGA